MQNLIIFEQSLRQIQLLLHKENFLSLGARCTRPLPQKLLIYVKWAETWFIDKVYLIDRFAGVRSAVWRNVIRLCSVPGQTSLHSLTFDDSDRFLSVAS